MRVIRTHVYGHTHSCTPVTVLIYKHSRLLRRAHVHMCAWPPNTSSCVPSGRVVCRKCLVCRKHRLCSIVAICTSLCAHMVLTMHADAVLYALQWGVYYEYYTNGTTNITNCTFKVRQTQIFIPAHRHADSPCCVCVGAYSAARV